MGNIEKLYAVLYSVYGRDKWADDYEDRDFRNSNELYGIFVTLEEAKAAIKKQPPTKFDEDVMRDTLYSVEWKTEDDDYEYDNQLYVKEIELGSCFTDIVF